MHPCAGLNPITEFQDEPMRSTQQFSITLPTEMAQMVKAKVSSGEYATESEVIREGLRALQAQDHALEKWLQTEIVTAYDELKADPASALSAGEILATLREATQRRLKKA